MASDRDLLFAAGGWLIVGFRLRRSRDTSIECRAMIAGEVLLEPQTDRAKEIDQ
jgi:hypothetical protein